MAENYTLKEMIQEVRNNQEILKSQSSKTLEHASNVDRHLNQLNSKVATHENDIHKLKTFQSKVLVVWGIGTVIVVSAINKFM